MSSSMLYLGAPRSEKKSFGKHSEKLVFGQLGLTVVKGHIQWTDMSELYFFI